MLTAASLMVAWGVVAQAAQPVFALSIVIPSGSAGPRLGATPKALFHVLLSNQSGVTQRGWSDNFSWGYYSLSFRLVGDDGVEHIVRKKKVGFTVNYPESWTVEPSGHVVFDVYLRGQGRLGRGSTAEGLP